MKRTVMAFLWALALATAATDACNEVTFSNTAPLRLDVKSLHEPKAEPVPLEGAQLCQTNTVNCDLADETGEATIELPIGEETSFTVVAEGHVPYLVPVVLFGPHGQEDDFIMRTLAYVEADFGRIETDYPMVGTGPS